MTSRIATPMRLPLFIGATVVCVGLIAGSLTLFGLRSLVSVVVVNWFVLAWLATVTLVADLTLPAGYYEPRPFERTGQLYERIGIRAAKRLVRRGPLRILSPTLELPKARTVSSLRHLKSEMQKAETVHVLTFVAMLMLTGYAASERWLDAALGLFLVAVLINCYPIMLQRYNRVRLQQVIRRYEGQATTGRLEEARGGPTTRCS